MKSDTKAASSCRGPKRRRAAALQIRRVRNRVYQGDSRWRVKAHAEYAVVDGATAHAYIIFNCGAWIVVQRSTPNSFGDAISPMNLTSLADVKRWAIEKWGTGEKVKGESDGK